MLSDRTESEAWLEVAESNFSALSVFAELERWDDGCYYACMSVEKFGKYLLCSKKEKVDSMKQIGHDLQEIWKQVGELYDVPGKLIDLQKGMSYMESYSNEKGPFSYRYPKGAQIPSDFLDEYQFQIHHRVATQARDLASTLSERTI